MILSIADRGAEHAGADVRQAGELEQSLHGAVLAVRAVQQREHDVDGERRAGVRAARARRARIGRQLDRRARRRERGRQRVARALQLRDAPRRPAATGRRS